MRQFLMSGVLPGDVAVGARLLPEAHRERLNVEILQHGGGLGNLYRRVDGILHTLQQSLGRLRTILVERTDVLVCLLRGLPRVRRGRLGGAHAHDRLERRVLQDWHLRADHLPESLVLVLEGGQAKKISCLHRVGVATAVRLNSHEFACSVGAALPRVVLARQTTRTANVRENHQVEGTGVNDTSDGLLAHGQVRDVLHIPVIQHLHHILGT
mmetsp:Transcript_83753/g.227057  ORF Transcript_83753/g.227057 Transcript_83753/m.227057 type:complete len:212 (-) Transcript_83753:351-986(-)